MVGKMTQLGMELANYLSRLTVCAYQHSSQKPIPCPVPDTKSPPRVQLLYFEFGGLDKAVPAYTTA